MTPSYKKDHATVSSTGEPLQQFINGVTFLKRPTHVDDRGFVVEMYDTRWDWHSAPMVFSYVYTVRPGIIKGWGMHKKHEDRYFILFGEMLMVLYDGRKSSPTYGMVNEIYMTEYDRMLVNIPVGVWHANKNVGSKDVVVVNFPTTCYDHADPDKYRLPIGTDKIPYQFRGGTGG